MDEDGALTKRAKGGNAAAFDVVAMDDVPTYDALRQALVLANTGHLVNPRRPSERPRVPHPRGFA